MNTLLRLFALPFTCLALLFGVIAVGLVALADWNQVRRAR